MTISAPVLAFARAHHGLVSAQAWVTAGHARSSFYKAIESSELVTVMPGIAALPGVTVGTLQHLAAAVLRHGPGVLLANRSGAWLWGAPIVGVEPVELITTRPCQRASSPRVVIHRPADRLSLRGMRRRGLPVTSPLRTLLDVGASAADDVQVVLESFVRSRHVTLTQVRNALAQTRRRGRRGVAALDDALAAVGPVVTDSELESAMRRVFERAGLVGWVFHDIVEGYEVDFCFRTERLIVEVDGWEEHALKRDRWERDRDRDFELTALGWLVARLTWRMVTRRPEGCAALLRAALTHRRVA